MRPMREESAFTRKRLAKKLVPGPRERLRAPEPRPLDVCLPNQTDPRGGPKACPFGKRPRWLAPNKRPL